MRKADIVKWYAVKSHDRHTVSLLTDHMVFAPKYRGKILLGDVAMITEGIICKTCNCQKTERQDKQDSQERISSS